MPSGPSHGRRRVAALLAAAASLLALAVSASPVASAASTGGGSTRTTANGSSATYAVNRPLCSQPSDPKAMRCYGIKRVAAQRGTAGAYRVSSNGRTGKLGGFSPADLAAVYGYNPRTNRKNLTVGIVLWHNDPSVLSDLNHFDRQYHLPTETSRSFRKVNQSGKTSPLPEPDRGASGEIALDTQAVRAVCNTCRILLVEARGPYDTDLAASVDTAVRLGADVVTNSYGTPERHFSSKVVAAYRHPGVAIVAASGDSGWYGWDFSNDPHYVGDSSASFPATSPYVIAVGGTTLNPSNPVAAQQETVWNGNGPSDANGDLRGYPMGASGGGCSRYFPAPAWQLRSPGYAAANCHGKRLVADMAMDADPRTGFDVYDSYGSGGWVTVGGTSLSSPLAAGLISLVGGAQGARYPASALYANSATRPASRYDVTVGASGFCGSDTTTVCATKTKARYGTNNPNKLGRGVLDCSFPRSASEAIPPASASECTATSGFDGPSGVGAPRSAALLRRSDPYLSVSYRAPIRHGKAKTFRAGVRIPVAGTTLTSLTWQFGDHRSTTRPAATAVSHAYRKPGRYTLTLTSHDSRGEVSVAKRTVTVR